MSEDSQQAAIERAPDQASTSNVTHRETEIETPVTGQSMAETSAGTTEAVASVEAAARKSPSLLDSPATYVLLALNFIVFFWMLPVGPLPGLLHAGLFHHGVWTGISALLTTPFDYDTISRFGGCDGYMVQDQGQWWRLLTGAFVHVTLLHILVNMWCLWNLGLLGEPLLGWRGLATTYALTGIAGNMLSLGVHTASRQFAMVAGASGAVFGIAGILIVLLSNRRLAMPWKELRSLRQSVVQFAVLNLMLGLLPQVLLSFSGSGSGRVRTGLSSLGNIDNMAHLGGFLCGLAMGVPLFSRMMAGRKRYRARQRATYAVTAGILLLSACGIARAHAHWAAAVKFR